MLLKDSAGKFIRKGPKDQDDFMRYVEKQNDGCWKWTGSVLQNGGYGIFWDGTRHQTAHRYSYTRFVGPIQDDLEIDHLCRNRLCVNPQHLESVTGKENVRRGLNGVLKTHCLKGHPLTGDNLLKLKSGRRRCRECHRQESHQRWLENQEARVAYNREWRRKKKCTQPC